MAEKKDYIALCRYYKGEDACPFASSPASLLWLYEKRWVEFAQKEDETLVDYLDTYADAGLALFRLRDGVPASLKALLFNRFLHWNSGELSNLAEPFKKWYRETYLAG